MIFSHVNQQSVAKYLYAATGCREVLLLIRGV
jgi:hypothetical protein